jgi:hypothetical protein
MQEFEALLSDPLAPIHLANGWRIGAINEVNGEGAE